jgi:hypothetical protein
VVPGALTTELYGDGNTTACVDATTPGVICQYGFIAAVNSTPDLIWGAGLWFQLSSLPDSTSPQVPFDAVAVGIAGFRVELSGIAGRIVRFSITQVPPYQGQEFILGGITPLEFDNDGTVTVSFPEFQQPSWTSIPDGAGDPLDSTQIDALLVSILNDRDKPAETYSFCISNFTWLDASGQPVDIP